jgi:Mg/Co/Ni transporter MgtE
VLSTVALILGVVYMISTSSKPSLDPLIYARDLAISIAAIAVGVAVPILLREFSAAETA